MISAAVTIGVVAAGAASSAALHISRPSTFPGGQIPIVRHYGASHERRYDLIVALPFASMDMPVPRQEIASAQSPVPELAYSPPAGFAKALAPVRPASVAPALSTGTGRDHLPIISSATIPVPGFAERPLRAEGAEGGSSPKLIVPEAISLFRGMIAGANVRGERGTRNFQAAPAAASVAHGVPGYFHEMTDAVELRVDTRIHRVSAGRVSLWIAEPVADDRGGPLSGFSIRVRDLLDLVKGRMDPALYDRLAGSGHGDERVGFNSLRSAGILVHFDDRDRLIFDTAK